MGRKIPLLYPRPYAQRTAAGTARGGDNADRKTETETDGGTTAMALVTPPPEKRFKPLEGKPYVLEMTEAGLAPRTRFGWYYRKFRNFLTGKRKPSYEMAHQRLSKVKALAVLSSDAVSSVAYGTEEIALVLVLAGFGVFTHLLEIGAAIFILMWVVAISYRQTIKAYPNGGGSYIVAHSEIGKCAGLIAAGALMVDYILTVAVSISSGVQALTSAVPELHAFTLAIALAALGILVTFNLRGLSEAASVFAWPTYLFIGSVFLMLAIAFGRILVAGHSPLAAGPMTTSEHLAKIGGSPLTVFLILRAFSSGCSAMTGVEAISNGVPAFKEPQSVNARATIVWMIAILSAMFIGITILARHFGLAPDDATQQGAQTILSKLGHIAFGNSNYNPFYVMLSISTFLILWLAANTSFADFPRLASILAHDGYMPHQFAFLGEGLGFPYGIGLLSLVSGFLLVIFDANTDRLIPLYAVGVFVSFTLSQSGMVHHWWIALKRAHKERTSIIRSMAINGVGATATGVVAIIIGATKFVHGAWVVVLLVPALAWLFNKIHQHYLAVQEQIALTDDELKMHYPAGPFNQTVVVPIGDLNKPVQHVLDFVVAYVMATGSNAVVVHVTDDIHKTEELLRRWELWRESRPPKERWINLVVLHNPYRGFSRPLLNYLDLLDDSAGPGHTAMVVLPELQTPGLLTKPLHAQTAMQFKAALLDRPNTIVLDYPLHAQQSRAKECTPSVPAGAL